MDAGRVGSDLAERGKARIVDPFVPYLRQRLSEGARNATGLWREIRALGYPGQVVAALKREVGPAAALPPEWRRPTPRRAVRALLSDQEPTGLDARFYAALKAGSLDIARAIEEAIVFSVMIRAKDHAAFDPWLERCRMGRSAASPKDCAATTRPSKPR